MTRVAVTTDRLASSAVAEAFAREGMSPVLLPCIAIHPATAEHLDRARQAAARADLIVVTSARAVSIIWEGSGMPDVPVAAVGPHTAEVVRQLGGMVVATGTGGARELVDVIDPLDLSGKRVFFPHARAADPTTFVELTERGAVLETSPVYDTMSLAPERDPVDAVAFGSPLSVVGWMSSRDLDGLVVGAIGPTTAAAVREAGGPEPVEPPTPSFGELAIELARRFRNE